MQNKVYRFYTELPTWAKGVVVIGAVGMVYIVGINVRSAIKNAKAAREAKNRQRQFDAELKNEKSPATFTASQYTSWANAIATAFSGCDYASVGNHVPILGTFVYWSNSGSTVYNIIDKFKTNTDFLNLQKAFGTKTIKKSFLCGGDYENYDLSAAITAQLNQKEINGINELLKKKGIKYQF